MTNAQIKREAKEKHGVSSLLSAIGSNPKIAKGDGDEYISTILHLIPADISGREVCPWRSRGCTDACLHTAGNKVFMKNKVNSRLARTNLFFNDRALFIALLKIEVAAFVRKVEKLGAKPCIRLNGTSDISWEQVCPELFTDFPQVQFYDYTKGLVRLSRDLPANYHLTFSRSENNHADALEALRRGFSVAIVSESFGSSRGPKPIPADHTFDGFPCVDGDKSDLRFTDPKGHWVVLRAKGDAVGDTSGFVVPLTISGVAA